jgi:hypothetical protein
MGIAIERARAGLSDLEGTAPERGVQRSRVRAHGLRCCRGDGGHAQRRRKHGADRDAGAAKQSTAGQGGM